MKTIKHIQYLVVTTFIVYACGNQQQVAEQKTELIEITTQQFETGSMKLGEMETRLFENVVKCNGTIVPLPNALAKVNAPINGWIKEIYFNSSQLVQKNQILMEIESNELIDLQKEFAIVSANLKRLKIDYERIRLLFNEKATSEKDFILVEAEYKATVANFNGLKLKIESVGLSAENIENGHFYSSYFIKSPIDGSIFNIKANIGSNVGHQSELIEIVNPDFLQIKLSVFSIDISKIKMGQAVRFKSSGSDDYFSGSIDAIGVAMDDDIKSISCFASIPDKRQSKLIANMYVDAEIITQKDTVKALPKSAIIKAENKYYILVFRKKGTDKYIFAKQEVHIGREQYDYIEIVENVKEEQILVYGGYYINLNE